MSKKMFMFLFVILTSVGLSQAYADSPSVYTCKGKDVALTFSTIAFGLESRDTVFLTLDLGKKRYTAGKANIESHKSVMGDVKSITLKFIPDVSISKASFILPEINLGQTFTGEFIDTVKFKSQLALTTIATPFIVPPYVGIVNKSNYVDLDCTATLFNVVPL